MSSDTVDCVLQAALKAAGETIGEVTVTGILANVQLEQMQAALAAAHARIELLATALAEREERLAVVQADRDKWHMKATTPVVARTKRKPT